MCSNKEVLEQLSYGRMNFNDEFKQILNIGNIIKVVANVEKQEFYVNPDHVKAGNCVWVRLNKNRGNYCLPVRVTRYIDLDSDYFISTKLDKENNRIICKQSNVKYQKPLEPMPERDLFVFKERNKGRTYTSIGQELGISRERTRQLYIRAQRELKSPFYYIKNQDKTLN